MTFDEKAMGIIAYWGGLTFYGGKVQKMATLQSLIVDALKEATLAERERAAKVAESNIPAPPTQWGKGAAFNAEKIAAAIRKGEVV